jgi:hypothetical protein
MNVRMSLHKIFYEPFFCQYVWEEKHVGAAKYVSI